VGVRVTAINGSPSRTSKTAAIANCAVEVAGEGEVFHLGDLDAEGLLGRHKSDGVTDAVNAMTDFTADGMVSAVDWTKQHTGPKDPNGGCDMDFVVKDGGFDPIYSKPGKPFLCVDGTDPSNLEATNQA